MEHLKLLLTILAIPVAGGIVGTRIWAKRRQHGTIAARLARWTSHSSRHLSQHPLSLLKRPQWSTLEPVMRFLQTVPALDAIKKSLTESGLALGLESEEKLYTFLALVFSLLVFPILAAFILDFNFLAAILFGLVLSVLPFIVIKSKAEAQRTKFCEQLPDAIDLMVAVLRSGHSVPQAVKAVAQEIPNPCGEEFENILHKMNLGQPLSQSLISSSLRFRSYELDLIRRAVAIQAEIGGSLAELLDKTNSTLRQRLKLARQLRVVTAQSRLSAQIVGLLPIILALGLNFMSPGYLQLLVQDQLGRTLLGLSIFLEVMGIFIMRKMSTMKV